MRIGITVLSSAICFQGRNDRSNGICIFLLNGNETNLLTTNQSSSVYNFTDCCCTSFLIIPF